MTVYISLVKCNIHPNYVALILILCNSMTNIHDAKTIRTHMFTNCVRVVFDRMTANMLRLLVVHNWMKLKNTVSFTALVRERVVETNAT